MIKRKKKVTYFAKMKPKNKMEVVCNLYIKFETLERYTSTFFSHNQY